ncbi:uncharacterized protein J7T54_003122 [Emericellopsis cladophorae]|uniref:Uncharacterized protein n=1 Tax=Emericellopsis cladophorae TaxID=2686198 RepID=A0A9Q0BDW3_9HYPO|nr:uncharacterized protein J7T54_003122 [Emericellopsis cladophorae]KAI6780980.1 hypothetical protein J7T54_003122 [Emericellopsis cladophorae]
MASSTSFSDMNLSIVGLGTEYPPYALKADALSTLSDRFYPESASMKKVLGVNRYTGIDTRSSIGNPDHPSVNKEKAPSIKELHDIFMSDGVPLAIRAAGKALKESAIDASQITHIVSTTCTDSANPGFDHYVAKELGVSHKVEKVLLHGVGCSGGLATLRTGANLALGHAARGKPARVLCVALEVSTTLARSELDSISELQETRIGACLFSDCASAAVLSNGIGEQATPIYDLLGWDHRTLPDTEDDLGFDVDPLGWKVVLTPRVPKLTGASIKPAFEDLMSQLPDLPANYRAPSDFDWAMHPGGATILTGAERAMDITPEHMRASYDTYINHGNSSSATIFSVMNRLRSKEMDELAPGGNVKDYVVGCAFGPGITVEMCMLKRHQPGAGASRVVHGLQTPPMTDSDAASDNVSDGEWSTSESVEERLPDADRQFVAQALEQLDLD